MADLQQPREVERVIEMVDTVLGKAFLLKYKGSEATVWKKWEEFGKFTEKACRAIATR